MRQHFALKTAQIKILLIFIATMANYLLLYNNNYWQKKLGAEFCKNNLENKLHLIFSLLVFLELEINLLQFLTCSFGFVCSTEGACHGLSWFIHMAGSNTAARKQVLLGRWCHLSHQALTVVVLVLYLPFAILACKSLLE